MYKCVYQPFLGWMLDVQDGTRFNEDDFINGKTYIYDGYYAYKLRCDLVRDDNGETRILLGCEITRDKTILFFHNQLDIPIIIDKGVPDMPLQDIYGYMKAATKNFDVDLFDKPHIYLCRLHVEELS